MKTNYVRNKGSGLLTTNNRNLPVKLRLMEMKNKPIKKRDAVTSLCNQGGL